MDWIQYAFLIVAALSALADGRPQDKLSCKDGETWMDDCNNCWCDNGLPACTLMGCPPKTRTTRDTIHDVLGAATCKEGDTWKEECNSCWCDNGHPACTQKACIPESLSLKRQTRSTGCDCDLFGSLTPNCDERGQCECRPHFGGLKCDRCLTGYHLGPDGCQGCDCDPFGSLRPICDERGQCECRPHYGGLRCDRCLTGYHLGPDGCQEQCVPLTAWKKGHVVCTCSHDGVELCEHELNRSKRDTTIEDVLKYYVDLHKDCTEGTVWKSNCADCKCTDTGPHCSAVPDCTPGPITPKKTSCEEGERWKDECNSCWCEHNRPVCTRKGCEGYPHYAIAVPDHPEHHVAKREASDKGCTPGKVWIQMTDDEGCAKFTCHADGSVTSAPHFSREMCPSEPQYIDDDADDGQHQHSVTKRNAGCNDSNLMDLQVKNGELCLLFCKSYFVEGEDTIHKEICAPFSESHNLQFTIPELMQHFDPAFFGTEQEPADDYYEGNEERNVVKREAGCKAGDTWMEDCNQCTCNEEGKGSCSRILCDKDHSEEIPWLLDQQQQQQQHNVAKREISCTPGQVWIQMTDNDEGCAKFTCQADGKVTSVPHFTREKCPSKPQYIDADGQYL